MVCKSYIYIYIDTRDTVSLSGFGMGGGSIVGHGEGGVSGGGGGGVGGGGEGANRGM